MKKYVPYAVLIGICFLFFYKTILFGNIPFPGDLLLTQYAPWRHESYGGYVAGAVPSKDQYFDVLRELYPWKTEVIAQIKNGVFPLWNPYNFSGAPLLANYQSQVFYPLTAVYFLLPQVTAWTIMVILQPMLGSVFLYLFATEIGLSTAAAMFAALLFNFSSFASVWIEFTTVWHTIIWIPLLLYIIERSVKQKTLYPWQKILFVTGLYAAITGGHPQDFINSFLLLCIYATVRLYTLPDWSITEKFMFVLHQFALIFMLPFLLAAAQLLPTIELLRNSARVAHDYQGLVDNMLIQWWQLPLVAVQDLFGNPATKSNFSGDYIGKTLSVGVVGFFFAVTALTHKTKSWHKTFFLCMAAGILLLTVRTPFTEVIYRYPWPILSTGTPTRNLFIFMLAVSLLAGMGLDIVRQNKKFPIRALIFTWSFFLFLWLFALVRPAIVGLNYTVDAASTMKHALLIATSILGIVTVSIVASKHKKIILWTIIPICIAELMYSFIKFNPFAPALFVYPKNTLISELKTIRGIDRIWGYGTTGIEANFATQEHLYSTDGTDPLNLKWYNQFLQSSREGNIALTFNRTTRSDAQLAPGYGKQDLPTNTFRLRVMDMLGVKYIIDRSENPKDATTFPKDRFSEVWHKEDWTIYENLRAAPRFFVTTDVRPYKNAADFERQLFDSNFQPEKSILVEANDYNTLQQLKSSPYTTRLISYTPNKLEIAVTSNTAQLLFISDTYDAGWRASINGKSAYVYKANYAFRGVVIPPGTSTVTYSYQPRSFRIGLIISIVSFVGCVGYSLFIFLFRPQLPQTKQDKT